MALRADCIYASTLCRRLAFMFRHYRKLSTYSIKQILSDEKTDQAMCVKGWVKGIRQHKDVTFLHVNDGSGLQSLQVIIPQSLAQTTEITFGSCVKIEGVLKESPAKGQNVELVSTSINLLGSCSPNEFPLKTRSRHSPQYTRDFLHLRPKTNVFSGLLRIRNVASMAVHNFFQKNNYLFIHTPILTSSDCEGACEVFKVEPLKNDILSNSSDSDSEIGNGSQVTTDYDEFRIVSAQEGSRSNYFFRQPSFLTVSGQLHLEVMTGAFTKVYNFGPVFRAENCHGSFHLSEFYMVEAEVAFIDKQEHLLTVIEELVKFVCKTILNECPEDVANFLKYVSPLNHMSSGHSLVESTFERLSYTDAIRILENSKEDFQFKVSKPPSEIRLFFGNSKLEELKIIGKSMVNMVVDNLSKDCMVDYSKCRGQSYDNAANMASTYDGMQQHVEEWGCDLKKEHEMFLTKAVGNIPVFVTDYPANIKPFYARKNDDGLTVAASDLLVPGVGELCGSSLREERADILEQVMISKGLLDQMPWYLEIRKFGSCCHGGFGLGFERLLMALLEADSLKDVIPFPRWPRNCRT